MSDNETYPCDDCIYKDRPEKIFKDACDGCHPNGYPYHTKREQMSNKVIPCPYCGDEPDSTGAIVWGATSGCPNQGHQMYKCKWNRRYVFPDNRGDKVYAGDRLLAGGDVGELVFDEDELAWCIDILDKRGNVDRQTIARNWELIEIELIKEDT